MFALAGKLSVTTDDMLFLPMTDSPSPSAQPDFLAIFEATPTPYLVLTPSLIIVAVNRAYLQATQRVREDLIDRHVFDAFPDNPSNPAANGVRNLSASLQRVLSSRLCDVMPVQRYDIPLGDAEKTGFEERYWSPVNTPVLDLYGNVGHILHRVEDVTDQIRAEQELVKAHRRQAYLLALADRIRPLSDTDDIAAAASELLAKHLGVARVMYSEIDDASELMQVKRGWTNGQMESLEGAVFRLDDFGPAIAAAVRDGRTLAVPDIAADERCAPYADAYTAVGVRSFMAIPLMKKERIRALLNVNEPAIRHWTESEIALAQDMVDRTWSSVERARAQAKQRETASRLEFTLEAAQIGDWDLDLVNDTSYRSLRHDRCFGYTEPIADWGFEKFIRHVHCDDREWVRKAFEAAVSGLGDWHFECRVVWPDGSLHWIAAHGSAYGGSGKPTRMAGIVYNITGRKEAEEKVRHAALHDALTGLPNRAMLFEYAGRLLPHNRRTNTCAAVLFLDLDRFKPINDTHGHELGDTVLKEAASRLSRSLRAEDIVIRLGGDEFVILLQDIQNVSYAGDVAAHIVNKINDPYQVGELTLSLSTSIGISIFPGDGQDIDTLISHADAAMYQAKQAGRNNYQFYSAQFSAGIRMQAAIEQQLRSALRQGDFHLFYQPVLDLKTRSIVSVEALIRWNNSDIGPEQFVPIAEATGIINPIGHWVLKEASRQHKAWIADGLPAIPIAVNVSVVEFRDRDFVSRFQRLLHENEVDPSVVQLELTETAVMDDTDHAVSVLSELKAMGVKILLDDFGTGYSSLAYLARLPLNKIKIDKTFICRSESEVTNRAIIEAMLALGQTLGLETVAEGVESAAVLDYILSHGCQQGQGYFFSRPMSGDDFKSWYRQHLQMPSTGAAL